MYRAFKSIWPFFFIVVLSFFAVKPLFTGGFFPMHDNTQVARVYEMGKSLSFGVFPVRWVPDLGYGFGYPIFNFYAPFAYYIGGLFQVFGFNSLLATKLMMVLGVVLAPIFMYILAKEFFGKVGGFVAAIFYLYAPYHALDIYVRGDVSEFFAYAFIPLVFLGFWLIYKKDKFRYVVLSSLAFTFLTLSHNLTAFMTTPFLLVFILFLLVKKARREKLKSSFSLASALLLGLGLSSFYWIPAIFEARYTDVLSQIGGGAYYGDHFVCLWQLWSSPWGYGGSGPNCNAGFSLMLGKYHILMSILAVLIACFALIKRSFFKNVGREVFIAILIIALGLLISLFLMLSFSKPIWDFLKPMVFFQYPWRFLLLSSFFSSLLAGSVIFASEKLTRSTKLVFLLSLLIVIVLTARSYKFFQPQTILNISSRDYTGRHDLSWVVSKISDEYMPPHFIKPKKDSEVSQDRFQANTFTKVLSQAYTPRGLTARLQVSKDSIINIKMAYFPGMSVYLDNKTYSFSATNNGLSVFLPKGVHSLNVKVNQTILELLSDLLALASLGILIIGIIDQGRLPSFLREEKV